MTGRFSGTLDRKSAGDAENYSVRIWSLKRTADYGSKHDNERPLAVAAARLEADGKTVHLDIPDIQPTWCMEIKYRLRSADGKPVDGVIHNTVHHLGD